MTPEAIPDAISEPVDPDLAIREAALPAPEQPIVTKTRWAWTIGTFFGAGTLHPGPGTFGSAFAMMIWVIVARFVPFHLLPYVTLGMAAAATAIGIPAATRVANESGRKDPQNVVIDEVAGQWLTLTLCLPTVPFALAGLVCFRIFDILKPPPIRRLEQFPAGTGIMVDDLGAGVYALLVHFFLVQPLLIGWARHAALAHK